MSGPALQVTVIDPADATLLPDFRPACEVYTRAVGVLSRRLLALFAQALALPPDFFEAFMHPPVAAGSTYRLRPATSSSTSAT